jgi:hypothetical protein
MRSSIILDLHHAMSSGIPGRVRTSSPASCIDTTEKAGMSVFHRFYVYRNFGEHAHILCLCRVLRQCVRLYRDLILIHDGSSKETQHPLSMQDPPSVCPSVHVQRTGPNPQWQLKETHVHRRILRYHEWGIQVLELTHMPAGSPSSSRLLKKTRRYRISGECIRRSVCHIVK